ncbi:hypothetical protein EJ08DRAFT_703496 [Tothia fuscella]|uniref:Uncharacterized protein n=1 Tax=Tothia fuscella TaxID=1048955 RepID=A0A9P4TSG3_9PEZI|nr:hypothetical protein EJ08DRAFT_703496 [Tothia fuscella]
MAFVHSDHSSSPSNIGKTGISDSDQLGRWWDQHWVGIATWCVWMYVIVSAFILLWLYGMGYISAMGDWINYRRHRVHRHGANMDTANDSIYQRRFLNRTGSLDIMGLGSDSEGRPNGQRHDDSTGDDSSDQERRARELRRTTEYQRQLRDDRVYLALGRHGFV